MSNAIDPDDRRVGLTDARWAHIIDGHPELRRLRAEVLRAVEDPTEVIDARPGQRWYYLRDVGPSAWLKVVVAFNDKGDGSILTAFPGRSKP